MYLCFPFCLRNSSQKERKFHLSDLLACALLECYQCNGVKEKSFSLSWSVTPNASLVNIHSNSKRKLFNHNISKNQFSFDYTADHWWLFTHFQCHPVNPYSQLPPYLTHFIVIITYLPSHKSTSVTALRDRQLYQWECTFSSLRTFYILLLEPRGFKS